MEPEVLLNLIYNKINRKVFDDKLPGIPVECTSGTYYAGATQTENGTVKRIIINLDSIDISDADTTTDSLLSILLHEMVHVYCSTQGIPDYNIEKKLHTAEFIDIAEDHGLIYDNFNNTNILIFDAEELLM